MENVVYSLLWVMQDLYRQPYYHLVLPALIVPEIRAWNFLGFRIST